MQIPRIEQVLKKCEKHLSSTSMFGTEIENLLTQTILVIMCSEFEQKIKTITEEKCSPITDKSLRDLCVGTVFRGVKSSGIADLLNCFGVDYKERFKQKSMENKDNEVAVTYYNNIVVNRHGVAHSSGTIMTFKEAKEFYEKGHVVLDFFRDALLISH